MLCRRARKMTGLPMTDSSILGNLRKERPVDQLTVVEKPADSNHKLAAATSARRIVGRQASLTRAIYSS